MLNNILADQKIALNIPYVLNGVYYFEKFILSVQSKKSVRHVVANIRCTFWESYLPEDIEVSESNLYNSVNFFIVDQMLQNQKVPQIIFWNGSKTGRILPSRIPKIVLVNIVECTFVSPWFLYLYLFLLLQRS